jgi:asparagine N-glycosylation enzyme membrane subunit Stt3
MTGRSRHRTHGGIPHGSTLNFGSTLQIYYQWKEGLTSESITITAEDNSTSTKTCVTTWVDQSSNSNNATQTTDENEPQLAADGSLDFYNDADGANADFMNFTSFRIDANTDFLSFIVAELRDVVLSCYLSDSGGEVLEYQTQNKHRFKTGGTATEILINDDGGFQTPTGEKHVIMVHRTNTSTGTIIGYKNGKGADSSITNAGQFDLQNLGSKNDVANFFDGQIYDVGIIEGTVSNEDRKRIEHHLLCKHGMESAV